MRLRLILIALLLGVVSCKYIEYIGNDQIIAEIGIRKLFKSEVDHIIPAGATPEDSLAMLRQYVNSWVIKNMLIHRAETELPKSSRDFEKAVEEYKNSLMVYSYEKLYIESKIDTTISESEALDYYHRNAHRMPLSGTIVKGRFIKIQHTNPNRPRIEKIYYRESEESSTELLELCESSSERFLFFNYWRELADVMSEVTTPLSEIETQIKSKPYIEIKDALYSYLFYFSDIKSTGSTPPFEYIVKQIKEGIIERRKQQLLKELEKEVLSEAIEKNIIKTNLQ